MAGVDGFGQVLTGGARWAGAMATEVALLPVTLRQLREAMVAIALLPTQIEQLDVTLQRAAGTLEVHLPDLSAAVVGQMSGTIAALGTRVHGLADLVDDALPQLTVLLDTLPDQITTLDRVVGEVGTQLGEVLPKLETVVVDELRDRVENLDRVVSELSATLTGVLGAIPGVRRSMRPT